MPMNANAQVRLLIADTAAAPDQLLVDDQIEGFLELNAQSVRRAAADALDAIASSETLVSKKIRTQDLSTDGPAVADSLRKHADRLRSQADDEDGVELFDIVDTLAPTCRPELTEPPSGYTVWGL